MEKNLRPPVVRFGVSEASIQTGELRKNGLKIRLSGQPFQVLAMLLERPGELVTREELQKTLWPDGTFVDFDHSLNTAINKIREAVGDSAENPHYVETLARQGYRFIAPVEKLGKNRQPLQDQTCSASAGSDAVDTDFRVGQWLVQPQLNLIHGPDGDTSVEPKVMEVLVCLAKQAAEVVPKEQLMQTVWADTFVTDEVLTNAIWELRKAFGDDAKNPRVIQTVFKKGYRLIESVSFQGREANVLSRPPSIRGDFRGVSDEGGSASRSPLLRSWQPQSPSARLAAFLHLQCCDPKCFPSLASEAARSSRASRPIAARSLLPGMAKTATTGMCT